MTRQVSEAFMEHPDGRHELIGTFVPRRLEEWQRELTVAEPRPILRFVAGPPRPMDETIKTHTFGVVHMRDDRGARFLALLVKPGDPVTWLREWTWRDPHLASRWPTP